MAKRKLFDKLNQYNANHFKDDDKRKENDAILADFDKFNSLHPSEMQNLINGVKDNALDGWITSVDFKHKEIDELATSAIAEHKKDYEAIKPKKPPKPQVSKDSTQTPPKTQVSENTTLQAPPKPPKPQVNKDNSATQQAIEDNTQENSKQTYKFKLPKLKFPKFRLSTPKIHSNPAETEEHTNKKETLVNTQNPNKISNNMRAKLNHIAEKAGNAFNSVFSSQKRENNKGMKK